jgi:hypothetical protein
MALVEGLPCRVGFIDSSITFLMALLSADASAPCSIQAQSSSLAQRFLAIISRPGPPHLLDVSPAGILAANTVIAALSAACPRDGLLADRNVVGWLIGLLAEPHISALLIWPLSSGGNRTGVANLLEAVCAAICKPFTNSEASPQDPVLKRVANDVQVCSSDHSSVEKGSFISIRLSDIAFHAPSVLQLVQTAAS